MTPQFRINETTVTWEVSYDDGKTWKAVGSAVDRSLIRGIELGENDASVTITLADGTAIVIPLSDDNGIESDIRIPYILRDNMVLQQNTDANIWGWAEPGAIIKVTVSWSDAVYKTTTREDGLWKVAVATPAASFTPQWVDIACGQESLSLENILIGEVWLCSGQSNMDMPMAGWDYQPVENSLEAMQDAYLHPEIRMFMSQKTASTDQEDDSHGYWWAADGGKIGSFSATAYLFGRELSRRLKVPVGLIVPCWSGSMIECWMDREALVSTGLTIAEINQNINTYKDISPGSTCTLMYNGMIYPIRHYTINGFIWYQGCSNVNRVDVQDYARMQAAMVTRWRSLFGRGDIPFYYVQIAPYAYAGSVDSGLAPILRERQKAAADLIPNSAMIATCDLVYPYERTVIHPRRKTEVGQRLANLALEHWYGTDVTGSDSPDLKSVVLQGASAKVLLTNCEGGVHTDHESGLEAVEGFEVAGNDKVWYPAHITGTSGNAIVVAASEVSDVKYVRYLWRDFQIGYLWNSYDLPVLPFTTE